MHKINLLLALFVMPILLLSQTTWIIDQNETEDFPSIQAAIDDPNVISGDIILVNSNNMNPYEPYGPLAIGNKGLTIQANGQATVYIEDNNEDDSCIKFVSSCQTATTLKNLIIRNGGPVTYGGGVRIIADRTVYIEDCDSYYPGYGGGICISNYSHDENSIKEICRTKISACHSGYDGGGLAIIDSYDFVITDCEIINNDARSKGGGAYVHNSSGIDFIGCLFTGNWLDQENNFEYGGAICISGSLNHYIGQITNCSIINNDANYAPGIENEYFSWSNYLEIKNSIVLDESDISNTIPTYSNTWIDYGGTNIYETDQDEVFIDADNDDYHLKCISPCVDRGDPSYHLDDDYSPIDMGCYPYEGREEFDMYICKDYNWICYPRLTLSDETNNGEDGEDYLYPAGIWDKYWDSRPSNIKVFYQNSAVAIGALDGITYYWSVGETYEVYSVWGYKVDAAGKHYIGGYLMDEDAQELYTYDTFPGGQESWLGYYLGGSQSPSAALGSSVMDDLLEIKTKRWSLNRNSLNDPWLFIPASYTFNYADLVIIKPDASCDIEDFQWQGSQDGRGRIEPYIRPQAEHFEWEEELDYLPVYVEFDPGDIPEEVAIYANGVCKGAQVVEDTICQICAYVLDEEPGIELEFAFYNGERSSFCNQYLVLDNASGEVKSNKLLTGSREGFRRVSFKNDAGLPAAMKYNVYCSPNPFNPQTFICFEIPEADEVVLDIFNVKGQHIRSLINEYFHKGEYQILWNGCSDSGTSCGSGVYFYKLHIGDDVVNSKMILMK